MEESILCKREHASKMKYGGHYVCGMFYWAFSFGNMPSFLHVHFFPMTLGGYTFGEHFGF
jgi:hypothetical protein